MEDKESQLDILESYFVNEEERESRAVIPPTALSPVALGNHSNGVFNNSHHSNVRRSSDDREEDLFLEEQNQTQSSLHFVDSWYSVAQEDRLDQAGSFEGRNDLSSSSGVSTDHDELKQSTTTNTLEQTTVEALEKLSLQCTSAPQQEGGCNVRDSLVCGIVKEEAKSPIGGCVDDESCADDSQPTLCSICLFKRRIIARDELEHALYFIPLDKFREVFPKIKKDEALVYHGTEFPMYEEHRAMIPGNHRLLHRHLEIADNSQVCFQVVHGQNFSIMGPCMRTVTLSEIHSKSKERIAAGFSVKVLARCTGDKDTLYEDRIRVMLQSGSITLHLIFPIAYYEASISLCLRGSPVTSMPEEDREALRSCHVALLENIGDAISLCEHLYQHKILDSDDLDEIRNISKKKDRNAYVLRTIQSRGNILDFVIKIMQVKRENQGAAAILQQRRYDRNDM